MEQDNTSCRVINSCVQFANSCGLSLDSIIESNGYAPEIIEDPYNWVKSSLFEEIINALKTHTGKDNISHQIGAESVLGNTWGGVENVILALGNAKPVLMQAKRLAGYFFKDLNIEVEQDGKNIIIRSEDMQDNIAYEFFIGGLLSIPRLWGQDTLPGIRLADNSILINPEGDAPSFFSEPETYTNYSPKLVDDIIFRLEKTKDLVEKKNEQLKENNRELKDAYKKLQQSTEERVQGEKLATIGTLASGIAHEINNPLSFIISNFRTLKSYMEKVKPSIKQGSKTVKTIMEDLPALISETEEGLNRVKKLVEDINFLAHPGNEQKIPAKPEDIIRVATGITHNLHKNDIKIVENYKHKSSITCVPSRISQAILNIIINSIHAIKEKNTNEGTIEISTSEKGKTLIIEIKDNGTGIPKENISQIFNPFFTTKRPGMGTGLGLSTVMTIIKSHQGNIDIESEEGKGTKVTLAIPF